MSFSDPPVVALYRFGMYGTLDHPVVRIARAQVPHFTIITSRGLVVFYPGYRLFVLLLYH